MFKNAQWIVTDYGIESVKGAALPTIEGVTPNYHFNAERLAEITERGGRTFYDWPVHIAEKTWVDIELFIEAFIAALGTHKDRYSPPADLTMLADSIVEARRIAKSER